MTSLFSRTRRLRRDATPEDAALTRALEAHLDPRGGSPYWLDRQRELGGSLRDELRTVADLARLGPFDRRALVERPLEDFVPRTTMSMRRGDLVLAETGGTSGPPVRTVFLPDELHHAFGECFLRAGRARGWPRGGRWLFVGPSGPHVIGQNARLLARLHGALEPFTVDLDPRWARNQTGAAALLYREHVLGQALDVVRRERPDVLFVTPPLLEGLARELPLDLRGAVRGIHLGGLPVTRAALDLAARSFPAAVVLPGYGNSMLGMLPEVTPHPAREHVDYVALRGRMVVDVMAEDAQGQVDLTRPVAPGERGRVVAHRLDETCFLPNLVERDEATAVLASPAALALGFAPRALRDPGPARALVRQQEGLY